MATISYLEYSNRDLKYAKEMFKAECYDPCGRFCQQSIEKRFKHIIELLDNSSDMKIFSLHSLQKLYTRVCECSNIIIDLKYRDKLEILTDYYLATDIPQIINIELHEEMARDALSFVEVINAFCDEIITNNINNNGIKNKSSCIYACFFIPLIKNRTIIINKKANCITNKIFTNS